MTNQPSLSAIRAKKQAALSSAARYIDMAEKARAEASEYETAEMVWLKLFGSEGDTGDSADSPQNVASIDDGDRSQGKPLGVPPVPDMIIEALKDAAADGAPGLTPTGMLSFIQQKHWSGARSVDVSSTAWRMWKDGRLTKPDGKSPLYGLNHTTKENEPNSGFAVGSDAADEGAANTPSASSNPNDTPGG